MREAALWLIFFGAALSGFFATVLSPWWLIGFAWFLLIGYLNANKGEGE